MAERGPQKVVVLSVSGLSAESGLPTLRDAAGFRFERGPATQVIPRVVDAWLEAAA